MIRKTLILFFILISSQTFSRVGSNSNFSIISQIEYNDRILKGKDVILKRYIVIPSIDKNFKDIFVTKNEKALLAKFSFMLNKNKNSFIEMYIRNCDSSLDINNLIKGLYYISKNKYSQAIVHLEKHNNEEYSFLKQLLIADCKYELLQDKNNYKSIIGLYQVAMDNTGNEQTKSIINNRIKYIKYQ